MAAVTGAVFTTGAPGPGHHAHRRLRRLVNPRPGRKSSASQVLEQGTSIMITAQTADRVPVERSADQVQNKFRHDRRKENSGSS